MFHSPTDVAFHILGFPVYFYGIILAVSVLVGVVCSEFLYKKFYDNNGSLTILDIAPWLMFTGIIGARLYYCLLNFEYYFTNPIEIFSIRQGGLSIHGMLLSGILMLFVIAKIYKLSFLKFSDCLLCAMPLAQSIGRWGNFFNSEAFGTPTNLPWKLFIPVQNRPLEYLDYSFFHPTFLYESLLDFLIFVILYIFFKKCYKSSGVISCLYLILYGIVRVLVEFLRIDSACYILGVSVAIWISGFMVLIGLVGLFVLKQRQKI